MQEGEDQGNVAFFFFFLHVYTVQQHSTLSGERKSGKSQNTATHMYADMEVMPERARQEEGAGEREREQIVLNCQVPRGTRSQIFSVCSRLRGD